MPQKNNKAEKAAQKFFAALRDVFIGAKIEGDQQSGFINLMRIKSR